MDRLSVHHGRQHNGISKPPVHHHGGHGKGGGKGKGGGGGKGIKVVYISSPMKLTASAEEFRAVVQELTGRDSNVADHDVEGALMPPSTYSSFGRASPTAAVVAAEGARAVPPTMATASPGAGRPAEYSAAGVAAPPAFQSTYDQMAGSLLYGQDYW